MSTIDIAQPWLARGAAPAESRPPPRSGAWTFKAVMKGWTVDIHSGLVRTARHSTSYLEAGPRDGPVVVLIHGWPEISLAWRHQLRTLSARGFRVLAPDLRGCGGSSLYRNHAAFSQREVVADLIEFADAIGLERAVWIGHDWGSAVAWNIASHHPERCAGVASLCVPYRTLERGIEEIKALLNRELYPTNEFPAGQFEYIEFYREKFEQATAFFEKDVSATLRTIMRRGDPDGAGKIFPTAYVRKQNGWFGGADSPPNAPLDENILSRSDLDIYVGSYERTGFFGIDSFYMNDEANRDYSDAAPRGGALDMPVLFLSGRFDYVCDTERSELMAPMKRLCADLTIATLATGHWMQHERPDEVSQARADWIDRRITGRTA